MPSLRSVCNGAARAKVLVTPRWDAWLLKPPESPRPDCLDVTGVRLPERLWSCPGSHHGKPGSGGWLLLRKIAWAVGDIVSMRLGALRRNLHHSNLRDVRR